jgi:hypothetical protein
MSERGKETIHYLDRIVAKPGRAKAILELYMEKYVPAARARGMTLVHRWVSPPVWLGNQSNTLCIIWTVQGAGAWWQAAIPARRDPEVLRFWNEIEALIVSRTRSFFSDVDDIESLCDV